MFKVLGWIFDNPICSPAPAGLQASIISIAKRSAHYVPSSTSADGHTVVTIMDGDDVEVPWHAVETAEEVVEELVSSTTHGLTQPEADRRWVAGWQHPVDGKAHLCIPNAPCWQCSCVPSCHFLVCTKAASECFAAVASCAPCSP